MNQIIKLSDNAANRIKEIMSGAEANSIGVRVGVKSGGCAGMSYVMEYTKEVNPNDEVIEDKGVKVFYRCWSNNVSSGNRNGLQKRGIFVIILYLKILTKLKDVDAESHLKLKT